MSNWKKLLGILIVAVNELCEAAQRFWRWFTGGLVIALVIGALTLPGCVGEPEATKATTDANQAIKDLEATQKMKDGAEKDAAIAKALAEAKAANIELEKVKAEADSSAKYLGWAQIGLGALALLTGMTGAGAVVASGAKNVAQTEADTQTRVSTAMANGMEHLKAVVKAVAPEAYDASMNVVKNIQVQAGVKNEVVDLLHAVPSVSEASPVIQSIAGLVTNIMDGTPPVSATVTASAPGNTISNAE